MYLQIKCLTGQKIAGHQNNLKNEATPLVRGDQWGEGPTGGQDHEAQGPSRRDWNFEEAPPQDQPKCRENAPLSAGYYPPHTSSKIRKKKIKINRRSWEVNPALLSVGSAAFVRARPLAERSEDLAGISSISCPALCISFASLWACDKDARVFPRNRPSSSWCSCPNSILDPAVIPWQFATGAAAAARASSARIAKDISHLHTHTQTGRCASQPAKKDCTGATKNPFFKRWKFHLIFFFLLQKRQRIWSGK